MNVTINVQENSKKITTLQSHLNSYRPSPPRQQQQMEVIPEVILEVFPELILEVIQKE